MENAAASGKGAIAAADEENADYVSWGEVNTSCPVSYLIN